MKFKNITGIILAGGKSRRIGVNKALLSLGDKSVVEIIKNSVSEVFEKVMLITNKPEEYTFLNIEMFPDIYFDKGPIAGIHSGLLNSDTEINFIISCDMPLLTSETIRYIADKNEDRMITVPEARRIVQPLCGIYTRQCLPYIEDILNDDENKNYSVNRLIETTDSNLLKIEKEDFYNENILQNINTIEEYQNIKSILNYE